MTDGVRKSLYSFSLEELRSYLVSHSFAKYAADQIYNWIYRKFVFDPNGWNNVSKKIKEHFLIHLDTSVPEISTFQEAADGTRKFLLRMQDGKTVETVVIPSPGRLTLCVSSQVGCAFGCKICCTGKMGFIRNLEAGEVVGELLAITRWLKDNVLADSRISNIVYMGQGEPLHNFENILQATLVMLEDKGLGIGSRKITLSTVGLVPEIEKLNSFPPINIAISLHAVYDNIRDELLPINRKYNLKRLSNAIKTINLKEYRRITYEYLLIDGLNDRVEDVEGLVRYLDRKKSKINIIPFNEYPGSIYKKPSVEKIDWFRDQLLSRDFFCTTRLSKGHDIMAACGQLQGQKTLS